MDGYNQDVPEGPGSPAPSAMPPTLWTVVLEAGAGTEAALERLCRLYWLPINAYLRRWGYNEHDAEDFTQTFLAHLLAKDRLAGIRRDKGRFRSYLLGALRNFVIDHNVRKRRLETLPLQAETPGDDRVREPVDPARTPEEEFERRFSLSLIQHALDRVREITVASDVYSLGAIIFELLAGRSPFEADSDLEMLRLVAEQEPPALRSINPLADPDLETICALCL